MQCFNYKDSAASFVPRCTNSPTFHSLSLLLESRLLRFTWGHLLNWRALPAGSSCDAWGVGKRGSAESQWLGPLAALSFWWGSCSHSIGLFTLKCRDRKGGGLRPVRDWKAYLTKRPKRRAPLRGSDTSLFSVALVASALHKGFKHPTLTTALISTTQLFTFLSHSVCLAIGTFEMVAERCIEISFKEVVCLTKLVLFNIYSPACFAKSFWTKNIFAAIDEV